MRVRGRVTVTVRVTVRGPDGILRPVGWFVIVCTRTVSACTECTTCVSVICVSLCAVCGICGSHDRGGSVLSLSRVIVGQCVCVWVRLLVYDTIN